MRRTRTGKRRRIRTYPVARMFLLLLISKLGFNGRYGGDSGSKEVLKINRQDSF